MKRTILFLITKSNWGGAQQYVYDLATNLDTTTYTPVVALGGDGELKTKLEQAGVRIITLTSLQRDVSIRKELVFMRELWRLLRAERPTVLHVNSSKAGAIGCLLGRLARVPRVIFTAHGWAFNEDRPVWQKTVIKLIHWFTVILSHQTISVSHGLKNQLRWPGSRRKMIVINPGRSLPSFVDRSAARSILTETVPALSPYQTDRWIIMVAELHPIKRHVVLFDAMKQLVEQFPRVRLLCIGTGQLYDSLSERIAKLDLTDTIFLAGHVPAAATLLKAADLFVLPSQSESYGYVLHEAALAELPIIATNVGGIPDIITSGVSGTLVRPNQVNELTDAITTYLTNQTLATQHAHAARDALANRTVTAMVTATVQCYLDSTTSSANADSRATD